MRKTKKKTKEKIKRNNKGDIKYLYSNNGLR